MEDDFTKATAPRVDSVTEGKIQMENEARARADQDRQDDEQKFELAAMKECDRVEKLRRAKIDKAAKK